MKFITAAVLSLAAFAAQGKPLAQVDLEGDVALAGNQLTVVVLLTNKDHRPVVGVDVLCMVDGQVVLNQPVIGILPKDSITIKRTTKFTGKIDKFDCHLTSRIKH